MCATPAIVVPILVDVSSAAWLASKAMWIGGSAGVANSWIMPVINRGSMASGVADVLFDAAAGTAAHLSNFCSDAELLAGSSGLPSRESGGASRRVDLVGGAGPSSQ